MVKSEKISAEETVRHIVRATRRTYNAEEKIRIVLEGLRVARPASPEIDLAPASARIRGRTRFGELN